jgi:hypothetical protein
MMIWPIRKTIVFQLGPHCSVTIGEYHAQDMKDLTVAALGPSLEIQMFIRSLMHSNLSAGLTTNIV